MEKEQNGKFQAKKNWLNLFAVHAYASKEQTHMYKKEKSKHMRNLFQKARESRQLVHTLLR